MGEIIGCACGALFFLVVVVGLVAAFLGLSEEWRERRALVRLARTYGVEYVPGEDLKALRQVVIRKRDAGLL